MKKWTNKELFEFIDTAAENTYAGGGSYEENPQRPGHHELVYTNGKFIYRDSYAGNFRSRGSEYVLYKDSVIWADGYGGGMLNGKESLSEECFNFLKKCMLENEEGFDSFRGPHYFQEGDWEYKYSQEGDVERFVGSELIYYKGELVFTHDIIGGVVEG